MAAELDFDAYDLGGDEDDDDSDYEYDGSVDGQEGDENVEESAGSKTTTAEDDKSGKGANDVKVEKAPAVKAKSSESSKEASESKKGTAGAENQVIHTLFYYYASKLLYVFCGL